MEGEYIRQIIQHYHRYDEYDFAAPYFLHISDASKKEFLGLDLDGMLTKIDPDNLWKYYFEVGIQDGQTVVKHIHDLARIKQFVEGDTLKTRLEKLIDALKFYVCDQFMHNHHLGIGKINIKDLKASHSDLKFYESVLNNTETCVTIKNDAAAIIQELDLLPENTTLIDHANAQLPTIMKSNDLDDCLHLHIDLLGSIISKFPKFVPKLRKFTLIKQLRRESLHEKASTAALTVDVDSDKDVEVDIEKLLTYPQQPITGFVFSTRSINLLNGGKFTDIFSGNNKYFKIDFEERTLVPRAERYQGRTKGHFAHLLSAILQTGRVAMKTLKYPPLMPVSTGGKMVTSLIADLNQQFEYVDPRLNALNTTSAMSLFSSNKANAINAALKTTKDLHAAEYSEYKTTAESKRVLEEIKKLEETIDDKRQENREKPNFRTAQNLEKAKAAYRKRIDELIEASLYKEERRFLVRAKDRVLSKRDLVKRFTQNLFRRGERGGRTLKRR